MLCEERGWKFPELAERMAAVGCPIQPSALYKMQSGSPPREVKATELIAFAEVFGISLDELVRPLRSVMEDRAIELAAQLPAHLRTFEEALAAGIRAYAEYARIGAEFEDLQELVNHRAGNFWNLDEFKYSALMAIAPEDPGLRELQSAATALWGQAIRYATRRASRDAD